MRIPPAAILALAAIAVASVAHASTRVYGSGLAASCSVLAIQGQFDRETLNTCTLALDTEPLGRESAAKTFVNRGVIYLRRAAYNQATKDFAQAERLSPALAEIFVNRGVVLMKQERWPAALAQLDKGIALNPDELEKAYYNRALAREQVNDIRGAYADFNKAVELAPDWDAPKKELLRYQVQRP